MFHWMNPVRCINGAKDKLAASAALCLLVGTPSPARAGDMDALGAIVIGFYVYVALSIAAGAFAFWKGRHIENRRLRALVRYVILVLLFTPIPMQQSDGATQFMPAFLFVPASKFNAGMSHAPDGPFHHPVLLAYGIVLTLGIPLLMAWVAIGEGQRRRLSEP
jgi:hypothetical protein